MYIQKHLIPCLFLFFTIISFDLKAQCCASPLPFGNSGFENYTISPNDQFNDTFDGFPASFLMPTGSGQGVTGNTAVPLGINFSDSQSPGNKATYTGAFYVNTPSNNFLWQRGNSICTSILGISIGTITACNRYKICAQAAGYSPSFLNSTGFVPDGNVTIALEVNFVRFSGGNVKVTKVINIPAVSNYNDIAFQNLEFEVIAPNGTFSQLSSFAMTVNDVNDGVIFDNFSICDLGAATTADCTVTTCVTPMVSSANTTTSVGTCTSGVPNNNAQIAFTSISNSNKADILEGSTFGSSITYTTAAYTVSGGNVTFSNLKHNTTYTVRLYNGSNACFTDIQLTTPAITCPCTQPTLTIANPSAVCTPNTVNITTTAVQTTNTGLTTTYWKDAAATIALDGASGAATAIQLSGTYYIKSSTSVSSCFIVQPVIVAVNPLPNFTFTSSNITCNGLNNGTITITTTSGTSPFTFGTDDGVSFPNATGIFNNLVPAAYKPAIRDANGCVRRCN